MKNFIGLFFVAFALTTNAHPAANQFTVVRGSVDADTNLAALNEGANRFMINKYGETIFVLAEKEKQEDVRKLAIIRQADPNAPALLATDWTPKQQKVVLSKDASDVTTAIPAAQSKGIMQKSNHQDAHTEQGLVVNIVRGLPRGADLIPAARATMRDAKDINDLEVTIEAMTIDVIANVDTYATKTAEKVNFEGLVFNSVQGLVDYATNYIPKSFPANEIFFAVDNDDLMLLKQSISIGEDVNTRDAAGNTPLHFATSIDCVQELVQNGADTNVTNSFGKTPLHYAVQRNSLTTVKYLVKKGNAFVWTVDNQGKTPYDLAPAGRVKKYLKLLMKSGKKKSMRKKEKSEKKEKPDIATLDIDALVKSTAKLSL